MKERLSIGQTLTRKVTCREPGKKPLIKWHRYFFYIQPNEKDEGYTRRFNLLKHGDIVSIKIELINRGYGRRINCNAYLVNDADVQNQPVLREQRESMPRASCDTGLARYISFDDEYQCRFGNSMPSQQEIEELRKKWIRTA